MSYEQAPPEGMENPGWCRCGWVEGSRRGIIYDECPNCGALRIPEADVGTVAALMVSLASAREDARLWHWHPETIRQVREMSHEQIIEALEIEHRPWRALVEREMRLRFEGLSKDQLARELQHPNRAWRQAVIRAIGRPS